MQSNWQDSYHNEVESDMVFNIHEHKKVAKLIGFLNIKNICKAEIIQYRGNNLSKSFLFKFVFD